jgi:RNA recognition motif-containing protein
MSVRLFVGNLAFGVTEAEVRELFSAAGAVSQVRLPTDRETGKPRGFAFVDFDDRAQAEEAIRRFDQHMFKDRAIAVNEARARESGPVAGLRTRPPSRPGASSGPRPAWTGPFASDPDEGREASGQPRRNFGPDAAARNKRKQRGRASKEERGPKGPLGERGGGQLFLGADLEDDDDDQGVDEFALWAREDAKNKDEE